MQTDSAGIRGHKEKGPSPVILVLVWHLSKICKWQILFSGIFSSLQRLWRWGERERSMCLQQGTHKVQSRYLRGQRQKWNQSIKVWGGEEEAPWICWHKTTTICEGQVWTQLGKFYITRHCTLLNSLELGMSSRLEIAGWPACWKMATRNLFSCMERPWRLAQNSNRMKGLSSSIAWQQLWISTMWPMTISIMLIKLGWFHRMLLEESWYFISYSWSWHEHWYRICICPRKEEKNFKWG